MPFVFHRNDDEHHLCPVRAYLRWITIRGSAPGPFFLADKQGVLIAERPLSYHAFRHRFEDELRQIGIRNWNMYGTHSFRRGGCQFYLSRGRTLTEICAWAGWDEDIDMALRYIIGTNQHLIYSRHDFTRFSKTKICSECQRKFVIQHRV